MRINAIANTNRIKHELVMQCMNMTDLAEASGVTHNTIVKVLKGEPVNPKTIKSIAIALNVEPKEIIACAE